MDLNIILDGFLSAFTPAYLFWLVIGSFLGTIIGIIPGLGPATGIAVLIPLTFGMDPISALILMGSIYMGSMYGGSRSSILINTPGDGSAIAATFDGYPMAKQGQAGPALAISAVASLFGGTIAIIGFVLLATPLSNFALKFGPAEYFLLLVFALAAFVTTSKGQIVKALTSVLLGLLVSTIGVDLQTGVYRFTFDIAYLTDGINFLVIIIGMYAFGEVLYNMLHIHKPPIKPDSHKVGKKWFTKEQWKQSRGPIIRSGPLGFLLGVLPGAGGVVASLMSYAMEKRISKRPEKFGRGAVEGLAAPEAANSSAAIGAMIPTLTLGVPGSGTTAVMLGALIMIGVTPGPQLINNDPMLVSTLLNSLFIGNLILVVINIVLIGVLTKVLNTPPKILYPLIIVLSFVGAYTLGYSTTDFYILIIFGIIGLFFKLVDFPTAPFILAVIIGADMEKNLRRALITNENPFGIFVSSNISIVLTTLTILALVLPIIMAFYERVKKAAMSKKYKY